MDVIENAGQRAFVGKVSMDRNSPDFYTEETTKGLQDAEEFVRFVISRSTIGRDFLQAIDQGPKSQANETTG